MRPLSKARHPSWPPWAGGGDFRRRAGSALTHPATVTALGVLLLNDLLLKALWPQSWFTGKLSDLAWLVFAPPLLAFLLSFAARRNLRAQRLSFVHAYVGLPILYAAFNTFDPVHDLIMRGISLAGGAAGSPRDVTDSLVIPLAWAVALRVWRRRPAASGAMRLRWAVLTSGVTIILYGLSDDYDTSNAGLRFNWDRKSVPPSHKILAGFLLFSLGALILTLLFALLGSCLSEDSPPSISAVTPILAPHAAIPTATLIHSGVSHDAILKPFSDADFIITQYPESTGAISHNGWVSIDVYGPREDAETVELWANVLATQDDGWLFALILAAIIEVFDEASVQPIAAWAAEMMPQLPDAGGEGFTTQCLEEATCRLQLGKNMKLVLFTLDFRP